MRTKRATPAGKPLGVPTMWEIIRNDCREAKELANVCAEAMNGGASPVDTEAASLCCAVTIHREAFADRDAFMECCSAAWDHITAGRP